MINVNGKTPGYVLLTFTFYILHFTFITLSLSTLSSCQRERILFTESAEIGGGGWVYDDSIRFAFAAQDTSTVYDLNLEITHAENYAWQNVYVRINTLFPDDSIKTDILSLELTDGSGAWAGKCGGQGKCRLMIPLQEHLKFPVPGDYGLVFVQYMRQEVVPGILGLKLTVIGAEGRKGGKAER